MKTKHRKALLHAGELIAREHECYLCTAVSRTGVELYNIPEAMMFSPMKTISHRKNDVWWGRVNMGELAGTPVCRNARLLGIAFMLTIPKEML